MFLHFVCFKGQFICLFFSSFQYHSLRILNCIIRRFGLFYQAAITAMRDEIGFVEVLFIVVTHWITESCVKPVLFLDNSSCLYCAAMFRNHDLYELVYNEFVIR